MKVAVFSTAPHDRHYLTCENIHAGHELIFFTEHLGRQTAHLAKNVDAVCCFVLDNVSSEVLSILAEQGVKLIACRSAGFDHVDLVAAQSLGLTVVTVPTYSPSAVAELAVLLILNLARKFQQSMQQFAMSNYLLENLLGMGIQGKTVGVIGTGNIGLAFSKIMRGFDCELLGYDPYPNEQCIELGMRYVELDELLQRSDIISINCLLNEQTYHLINAERLKLMQSHALLVNTSRGPVVDTQAVIDALDQNSLGGFGTDVYEKEKGLFFTDHSNDSILDPVFNRLVSHPNIIVTGHQAFFTHEAVTNIARTTIQNITAFAQGDTQNEVKA